MHVTAQEEFGLRCLLQLTRASLRSEPLSTAEIAEAEGVSEPFVAKIMASLKAGGLVTAVRGRKGGYTLSRNPRAITVDEALTVLGGRLFDTSYCTEHTGTMQNCVHTSACAIRHVWGSLELVVSQVLRRVSLGDLVESDTILRERLARAIEDQPVSTRVAKASPGATTAPAK